MKAPTVMMFRDARQLSAGTSLETDLCIVGAGAAGITLAWSLRDAGFRVLLLESGGLELEDATQELYKGENRGAHEFDLDVLRTIAGRKRSVSWVHTITTICRRGSRRAA